VLSEIIPTFARKPLFGYSSMVFATAGIAFLSFIVWAHHMFTVGMPLAGELFFMYATMLIAIPTGVKIFNWIATMWGGQLRFTTAMLFAVGFISVYGGLSGVLFALVPIDRQTTDTYFRSRISTTSSSAGPCCRICRGVLLVSEDDRACWTSVSASCTWLFLIGFHLTFFVQHFLGLMGMPRRVHTYPICRWGLLNMIRLWGAFTAVQCCSCGMAVSLRGGQVVGDNLRA
jgi:cytochrome c oxidase subunit 1